MKTRLNFKMLTIARELRELTQTQVSEVVPKLSQASLSRMEKGLMDVPSETIKQIAAVLDFPVEFFYEEYSFKPLSPVYYRKNTSTSVKKVLKLEATGKILSFIVDNFLNSVDVPEYKFAEFDLEFEDFEPDEVARRTRYLLGVEDGPIKNLTRLLEKNGVMIIELDADIPTFSGMSMKTNNGAIIMCINGNMPNDRKRFTIAHELGHIIMHIPFLDITEKRNIEKEANIFAAEFLMPIKDFRKDFMGYSLTYNYLSDLKMYWRASKQAILHKAYEEKLITKEKYTSMMVQLSQRGERKLERITVDYYEPTVFNKMIELFEDNLDYSRKELNQYLKVNLQSIPLMRNKRTLNYIGVEKKLKLII